MHDKVTAIVKRELEELNDELEYESLENPIDSTSIFGGEEGIDSLSLVTLIVSLEQQIEEEFGKGVVLSDEKAMSLRNSPYRTVESLVGFIVDRLE